MVGVGEPLCVGAVEHLTLGAPIAGPEGGGWFGLQQRIDLGNELAGTFLVDIPQRGEHRVCSRLQECPGQPWDLLVKAVEAHTDAPWVLLYVKRWLQALLQQP